MRGGTLTDTQLDHFRAEGYLRIRALLDGELIGSLRDEYDRVFAEARATDRYRAPSPCTTCAPEPGRTASARCR